MSRSRRETALWVALGLALSACSLAGLDQFDIPACDDNRACQPLNEREGIGPDACEVYQCRADGVGCEKRARDMDDDGFLDAVCAGRADDEGAELDCDDGEARSFPGNPEVCDGLDNDCDGVVDEEVSFELERTANLGLVGEGVSLTYGDVSGATPSATVFSKAGIARTSHIVSDTPSRSPENLQFGYLSEQNAPDTRGVRRAGCPLPGGHVEPCSFAEAAVASLGEEGLADIGAARGIVFAINTLGCAHGQVRVGYLRGERDVLLHGPAVHSNLFEGVDLTAQGCTGESRASGVIGAAGLAAAGLSGTKSRFPQALGVWLAESKDEHGACRERAVSVEALGVWLESTDNREGVRWTNGTGNGLPLTLGVTRGEGRPAVVALQRKSGAGYFVAYGAAEGGVALHFVPRFVEPKPYSFTATEPRNTAELGAGFSSLVFEGARADEVSLTLREAGVDGAVELGVVWLDGTCGATRAVRLGRVTVNVETGEVLEGSVVSVATAASRHRPSAVATEQGFVTEQFKGKPTPRELGGYLVAWTGVDQSVRLARVSDATGDVLGLPTQVFDAALAAPLLYDSARPRLAAYSDVGEVISGDVTCGRN